jgi:hypothetical protein
VPRCGQCPQAEQAALPSRLRPSSRPLGGGAEYVLIDHPGVEPTNNAAEQALRTLVLKRKISGPTRSRRGDEFIARGYSAMETCRRQGRDLLDYLHGAVIAWIDKTAPPSLLQDAALPPVPTG